MKKKLAILVALGFLAVFGAAIAYRTGLWIPNFPSESVYPVRGIDVSHHQGKINWDQVKKSRIKFTYIKATEGSDHIDSRFSENWHGSDKAGIRHGAYHFFTLKTSGKAQAENFIKTVPIEDATLPPVIDLEFGGNSSNRPSVEEFQRELLVFMDELLLTYNQEPILYTDQPFLESYLKGLIIQRLWIRSVFGSPSQLWTFWQFSERNKIPGINGYVDANVYTGSRDDFDQFR